MSGSVTPARRRCEDDDSEIEDFSPSVDGDEAPRSSGRKRARVDTGPVESEHGDEREDEAGAEAESGDLLPNSYRRSPKTTGRGVDLLGIRQKPQTYQPGSI